MTAFKHLSGKSCCVPCCICHRPRQPSLITPPFVFPLDLFLDDIKLYYLRGLRGIIVLCHQMRLLNQVALILISVEMSGVMGNVMSGVLAVDYRGNILLFIENNHLYYSCL